MSHFVKICTEAVLKGSHNMLFLFLFQVVLNFGIEFILGFEFCLDPPETVMTSQVLIPTLTCS